MYLCIFYIYIGRSRYDFAAYEPVHPKLVHAVDQLLVTELPLLMKMLPTDAECRAWEAEDAGGAAKAAATASTEEGAVLEAPAKVRARPPACPRALAPG